MKLIDRIQAEREWAALSPSEKAVAALEAIRDLPSDLDLYTNAVMRAMWEYARIGLGEQS